VSRDPLPDPRLDDEPPDPSGHLRTTGGGTLLACLLVGLVLGWSVRRVAVLLDATAPQVTWLQAAAFFLVAAILAVVARATRRDLRVGRPRLRAHEAVNRLVLAKSCALTGALVAGGYLGYALSWVGSDAELSSQRIVRSLVAVVGAALTVAAALVLERACRVPDDEGES
jgi:hypothetical protein